MLPGTGEIAQLVKCLPRKHGALSSIPSTHTKSQAEQPTLFSLLLGRQTGRAPGHAGHANLISVPQDSVRDHVSKCQGVLTAEE